MIKYVIPSSEKELLDARRAGCIIELNGTAINVGYDDKSKFSCDLSNELSHHNSYFRNKKGKS